MSEVVAEGIVEGDRVQAFLDCFDPIVHEASIHLGDRGMYAGAVDPANVALTEATLAPAGFESFDAPGSVTIGANLDAVEDRLDVANAGDLVNLGIDMETRMLQTRIRNIEQNVGLIDPDAIRNFPDDPLGADELPNYVVLEGSDFTEAIDVADKVSDHVAFRADPDAREFVIYAEGDTDDSRIAYGDEDVLDADVDAEVETLLSLDYAMDMVSPIPDDAEVTIHFGDEFPTIWQWEACDGYLSVEQMISPRIQSQ